MGRSLYKKSTALDSFYIVVFCASDSLTVRCNFERTKNTTKRPFSNNMNESIAKAVICVLSGNLKYLLVVLWQRKIVLLNG